MSSVSTKRAVKGTLYHKHNELSETKSSALPAQPQVQNVPSAKVYIFGDADLAEEELLNDGQEAYELRPRGNARQLEQEQKPEKEPLTIERLVEKGDTLSKIAVKYCCEVADLKRFNNLISDQDFFRLTSIKVPVQRHSLVKERLEEEVRKTLSEIPAGPSRVQALNGSIRGYQANSHSTGSAVYDFDESRVSDNEEWAGINATSDEECDARQKLLVRTVRLPTAHSKGGKEAENFLKHMDQDIKNILTSTRSQKKNLEEVRTSLTSRRIYPLKRRESVLGADCGLKFGVVLCVVVVVALLMPLLYFLYFEYIKPEVLGHHKPEIAGNHGS